MRRYLSESIENFSKAKPLLLAGPRQVGTTALAKAWLGSGTYLNWDLAEDRTRILLDIFTKKVESLDAQRLVLNQAHKYQRWKSGLKGLADRNLDPLQILVTGSARPDTYQLGGDSLLGRNEYLRVHPLSVGELRNPVAMPLPPLTSNGWLLARDLGRWPKKR